MQRLAAGDVRLQFIGGRISEIHCGTGSFEDLVGNGTVKRFADALDGILCKNIDAGFNGLSRYLINQRSIRDKL